MNELTVPKDLYHQLANALRDHGEVFCVHPGSDVEHRIYEDRGRWHVETRNALGTLREQSYRNLESIALALNGSQVQVVDVGRAVNE